MAEDTKTAVIDVLKEIRTTQKSDQDKLANLTTVLEGLVGGLKAMDDKIEATSKATNDRIVEQQIGDNQKLQADLQRKGSYLTPEMTAYAENILGPTGMTKQMLLTMETRQLNKYVSDTNLRDRINRFQQLNDDALIVGTMLAHKLAKQHGMPPQAFIKDALKDTMTGNALQQVHKALTTAGSGTGAEWIPTVFSSQMLDIVTVSLKVANLFTRINMPHSPYKIPIATSDDIGFFVGENTSDNVYTEGNVYPKFTPGTDAFTMTAKKFADITVFSEEVTEESIIPVIEFLRGKIVRSIANAEERCTLDGDTTAPHMDNDVSAATDARKAFKGLRKLAQETNGGANWFSLATMNIETLRAGRALLSDAFAENPEDLVYIINVPTLLKMLNFPEVMTMDKYNGRATIVTGELGNIDGIPLVTSKYARRDVAATGVNTVGGPNTKSVLYLVNRRGFWYGDRRELAVNSMQFVISGQGLLVASKRMDFKDIYPVASAGNKTLAVGRDITN